jgi:hypothetical protein
VSISGKGEGQSTGHRPLNAKAAVAAETAKREAELRAQFVVVPPGDEAKPISCPICKETIKAEFIEDDEDWVWKNAVKKDDRVSLAIYIHVLFVLRGRISDIPCYMPRRGRFFYQQSCCSPTD